MSIEENGHTNGEMEEVSARHDSTAEQSFDELARGVSTGTVPRRKALGMLAATLFGGAFVAAPVLAAPSDNRKPGGTGCPKAGQIRQNGVCQCGQSASGQQLTTCNPGTPNEACIDPNTCGQGQTVNTTSCQCECASGKVFCGGRCITDPKCGADQILLADQDGTCSCQCRDQNQMLDPADSKACVCDPTKAAAAACTESGGVLTASCGCNCPDPEKRLNNQGQCECRDANKAPTGPTGQCVCTRTTCPISTQTVNPVTCACECPTGEVVCGSGPAAECITQPTCGPDQFFSTTSCSCECKNDLKKPDDATGLTCVCSNTTCPISTQTVNPATCACECPAGETACGGECVSTTCPDGQFFSNCQCRNTCGAANCRGCCEADATGPTGICNAGTTAVSCGTGGETCTSCPTPPANATAVCTNGECDFACNTGFTRNAAGTGCQAVVTCVNPGKAVNTASCTKNSDCCSNNCKRGAGAGTGCGSNTDCTCRPA